MVAYRHSLASSLNGVPQGVPTTLLKEAIEYHSTRDKLLLATFEYEGQLTKVLKGGVGASITSCECTFACGAKRAGKMLDLDRALVQTLVTDYINMSLLQ
jgi:hypothetical protein